MKAVQKWIYIGLLLLQAGVFAQAKNSYPVRIRFQHWVGDKPLLLDSTYTNPQGEAFTVRNFRYYISNLFLFDSHGKSFYLPDAYLLLDARKPELNFVTFNTSLADIASIQFTVGVDSIKNVSGVQTGALDPANGMFWTWNSGYIFAKLEGTSPQSQAPQHGFTYHIGGFRSGENAQRMIVLPVIRKMDSTKQADIVIKADVNAWFTGSTSIKIAELPSIMTPGPLAMQVADNYSKMFSLVEAK